MKFALLFLLILPNLPNHRIQRTFWQSNDGKTFVKKDFSTQWNEYNQGRKVFEFEETERNQEFVVLEDKTRNIKLKLFHHKILWGKIKPEGFMGFLCQGQWITQKYALK